VYVRDRETIPSSTYFVHTQCGFGASVVLSAGDGVTTWKYGDTNGDGIVNAVDIGRTVDCVKGIPGVVANPVNCHGSQVWPCDLENHYAINAIDISKVVEAVKGLTFGCAVCGG
jgi:hypothetical protein